MKPPAPGTLQQVYVPSKGGEYEPISSCDSEKRKYLQTHKAVQESLLGFSTADPWHKSALTAFVPRPILVSSEHKHRINELNDALVSAITDIVERWWADTEARFPDRMPLETAEEDLLRWIDSQVPHNLPPFRECRGSWRPDFLVEEDRSDGASGGSESFRISEINARFSFNGYMYAACGQQALKEQGISDSGNGLVGTTEPAKILGGILNLFNPDVPLHLLKGEEYGNDIHIVVEFLKLRFGISPRFVQPSELRLVPDSQGKGGYRLCCVVEDAALRDTEISPLIQYHEGEALEEIHQVGLELHQREIRALSTEMLHQISLRCFNDMRTVLLVHDKRMLGIVQQELDTLVQRNVITPAQATMLDQGIANTILPGSMELDQLISSCEKDHGLKNEYLLKPIRSGKGDGIVFGEDIDSAEWLSRLEGLRSSQLQPGGGTCVVQRKVNQIRYDVVLSPMGVMNKYPLIGTYHAVHGEFLGIGVWRSSPHRICAISHGGAWTCSVTEGSL